MIDQYGNEIPDDLIPLDWCYIEDIPEEDQGSFLTAVDQAEWYDIELNRLNPHTRPIIAISWSIIKNWQDAHDLFFDPIELDEAGVYGKLDTHIISLVDNPLHRYNSGDGFFHA